MLEYREIYAGGRLRRSASAEAITVVNPATEAIVGTAPAAVPHDVDVAVRAARLAFDSGTWSRSSQRKRSAAVDRLAKALAGRAEDIARLVTTEMGMPLSASRRHNGEFPVAILRYCASLARALNRESIREMGHPPGHAMIQREPVGVCAVIAPWNYPLELAFSQLAPALAAGCTVVLKPAPQTSLSAYVLAEAVEAAAFPPGVFNLVTGGDEAGELLARHPGVDKVALWGRSAAVRGVAVACSESLKPVSVEHCRKAAAIVLEDADVTGTCAGLASLAFMNAGQTSFAASHVLVHRSRFDDMVAGLAEQAAGVQLGDPLAPDTVMGPLVSPQQRSSVESHVAASVAGGARVVIGGRRPASPIRGYYFTPTVLTDPLGLTPPARELFGPVVTVIPYQREAEAVAIANRWGRALADSVWTSDSERGLKVARRLHTGTFGIHVYVADVGCPPVPGSHRQRSALEPERLDSYLKPRSVFLMESARA